MNEEQYPDIKLGLGRIDISDPEQVKQARLLNELNKLNAIANAEADIEQMKQQLGHALPPQSMSASEVYTEPQNEEQKVLHATNVGWWEEEEAKHQAMKRQQQEPEPHTHGPFMFIMNQNHNALRGCIACGATWIGLMAGSEDNLVWHPVGELPEEEE